MTTLNLNDAHKARLLRLFSEFIEHSESDAEQTWHDQILVVQHDQKKLNAIVFCHAENAAAEGRRLIEFVQLDSIAKNNHQLYENLEVYWIGDCKPVIPEDHGLSVRIFASSIDSAWLMRPQLLKDGSELGDYVRATYASRLRADLKNLPIGDGPAHEKLLRRILFFALNPIVRFISSSVPSAHGRSKRDMLIGLTISSHLREYFRGEGLNSNRLVVEAKNQQQNSESDIRQISDYISSWQAASIGLLITRRELSQNLFKSIVERRVRSFGMSIILPLSDADLVLMIGNAETGMFGWNEIFLMEVCDKVQAATP